MKNWLYLSVIGLATLASCQSNSKHDGYSISGKIEGLEAKELFLGNPGLQKITDTAAVTNGAFEFTGKVTDTEPYMILNDQQQPIATIFLENDSYKIEGKLSDPTSIKVTGGKQQTLFDKLQAKVKGLNDKFQPEFEKIKADANKVDSIRKAYFTAVDGEVKAAIKENPAEVSSAFAAMQYMGQGHDVAVMEETFKMLSPENQASKFGKMYADMIAVEKKFVGEPAIDFTQNDVNGKPVSLSSYKGKYVLVDFWASWCKPCRAENPNVVQAYNKYKAKNFDVLGVSLDKGKEEWVAAIKQDGLPWTHVSDLQYWQNAAAKLYGIQSIPFNLLIDPNGIVVAKNLRAAELDKKLGELLK